MLLYSGFSIYFRRFPKFQRGNNNYKFKRIFLIYKVSDILIIVYLLYSINSSILDNSQEYNRNLYYDISTATISLLNKKQWYNDEIINAYSKYINTRITNKKKVYCLSTFFHNTLKRSLYDLHNNYDKLVKYWNNKNVSYTY